MRQHRRSKSPIRLPWRSISMLLGTVSFTAGVAGFQSRVSTFFPNPSGMAETVTVGGPIDTSNPFFQDLGTNGRRCVTCHQPEDNWSISVEHVRDRFEKTSGLDPLFRPVDGSNSPLADTSTVSARRLAYSMLLNHGVIRVERPIPPGAEFELIAVDDPYGYANASRLSLFRRPLPATNLRFLSTVMWDGREVDPQTPMSIQNSPAQNEEILRASLANQALDATTGHAQGAGLTSDQQQAIVDFELGLSTAQVLGNPGGMLNVGGARGGANALSSFPFYIGINDNVADPSGPFNPEAMRLFSAWLDSPNPVRRAIARGEEIFNSKTFQVSDVKGLNDNPYFGSPSTVTVTCTSCHNDPNVGNHSIPIALDLGLTDAVRRTPDMPLYTLRNKATGETVQTTDPGLALSTGKWKDIGRFKGPILRGLAGRAPYFHNGSAKDLDAVIDFYTDRFGLDLTPQERADLIAFLKAL